MVTMGGCASFSRALGVSQILVAANIEGSMPAVPPCTLDNDDGEDSLARGLLSAAVSLDAEFDLLDYHSCQ